jgi:hypothetical protein
MYILIDFIYLSWFKEFKFFKFLLDEIVLKKLYNESMPMQLENIWDSEDLLFINKLITQLKNEIIIIRNKIRVFVNQSL